MLKHSPYPDCNGNQENDQEDRKDDMRAFDFHSTLCDNPGVPWKVMFRDGRLPAEKVYTNSSCPDKIILSAQRVNLVKLMDRQCGQRFACCQLPFQDLLCQICSRIQFELQAKEVYSFVA